MHYSLFTFLLALNSVLHFWKLSVCEFLLGISETLLCSTSARVKIVLLDALHLLRFVSRDAD
jgi:hypothetical protein